jgi:hypothetical protein
VTVNAYEVKEPAKIFTIVSFCSAVTKVGTSDTTPKSADPIPSCPSFVRPKLYKSPSSVRTSEWLSPVAIAIALPSKSFILVGS